MPHFGFQADGKGFFGELLHVRAFCPEVLGERGSARVRTGKLLRKPAFPSAVTSADAGCAAPRAGRDGLEALESTKFYHGVVLPRQSIADLPDDRSFLCGAKTRVLYSAGR